MQARARMAALPFETEMRRKKDPGPGKEETGPERTKILQAMEFYRVALKNGPRNPRELLAEGKRQGHTGKTQERARNRLYVKVIPPTTWQGSWLIALPNDQAVGDVELRRKEKNQKKQERQGNGQRRRKRNGSGEK